MHVLTVLVQTPLIFHFSRPQPSFKLLWKHKCSTACPCERIDEAFLCHSASASVWLPGAPNLPFSESVMVLWVISSPWAFLAAWGHLTAAANALPGVWVSTSVPRSHCRVTFVCRGCSWHSSQCLSPWVIPSSSFQTDFGAGVTEIQVTQLLWSGQPLMQLLCVCLVLRVFMNGWKWVKKT